MNLGTLDLVSIVPWEIITQLINLLLLFLLLKHFLFKPVQNILNARQAEIDKSYADAETAQTRAEELLRSDSSRTVTNVSDENNTKVYRISGASNDANVVYQLTLTYSNNSNTSQKVEISASCEGYSAVTAEKSCDVVLKTNYTDASAYPTSSTVTESQDSGWGNLKNRIKTDDEWKNLFANDEKYKKYDFGVDSVVGTQDSDRYIINTTDYPINSVKFVQYGMQFKYNGQIVYPIMQAQAGMTDGTFGSGGQYSICGNNGNFKNVYIYVGSKSNVEKYKFVSQYEFCLLYTSPSPRDS